MKKGPILHGRLSQIIAEMGHFDLILIADAGMPIPKGVEVIDLALTQGQVAFLQGLEVVLKELEVQKAYIANETQDVSPKLNEGISKLLDDSIYVEKISHEELKEKTKECKAVIRTGEFTPYANIMLESGVVF